MKLEINAIKEFIKNNSECELVSKDCIEKKLLFKCKCGNLFYTRWCDFKNEKKHKRQCNKCSIKIRAKNKTHDYYYIKDYIEKNSNCKFLSTTYNGNSKKAIIKM